MSGAAFIAVDWGTTNRRAYRVEHGRATAAVRDSLGVLSVSGDAFPAKIEALRAELGPLPMLLAGMVGSNRGWVDTRYVPAPASAADLAAGLVSPCEDVFIVPGVCRDLADRPDVMRGEEVQFLGAVAEGLAPPDALLCQPGTHAKWAIMHDGKLADFTTAMTGEMFALLKDHSLIGSEMQGEGEADAEFRRGVEDSTRADLLSSLFAVRAGSVLGRRAAGTAAAYVSGLLIGTDCRARLKSGQTVYLLAEGRLARLYATAIAMADATCIPVDSETAFIAGLTRIWDALS